MENIKETLKKLVYAGKMFMCDENTPYVPENLPSDVSVMHRVVDRFENGDVICANCKHVLDGPNKNI